MSLSGQGYSGNFCPFDEEAADRSSAGPTAPYPGNCYTQSMEGIQVHTCGPIFIPATDCVGFCKPVCHVQSFREPAQGTLQSGSILFLLI